MSVNTILSPIVKPILGSILSDGGEPPPPVSPEVQLVFDRMSALSTTERNAIETFVDEMVFEGYWTDVFEFYAPCLNGVDFLTGFKVDTLTQSAQPGVHTPGQYIDFINNAQHLLEGRNLNAYSVQDLFMGCYVVMYEADTTGNSDLYGLEAGGLLTYLRWRGDDDNDFNEHMGNVATGARSPANQRPTGDFVGLGRVGNNTYNLQPLAVTNLAVQPFNNHPTGFPVQWHGHNVDGTPAGGNMTNSRYSCMLSMIALNPPDTEKLRALVLEFLINIGVTGVPVP